MGAPTDQPPHAGVELRRTRHRLRRRILLIVLVLGFLPSLLTLFVASTSSVRTMRVYAQEQAGGLAFAQAERLTDRLQLDIDNLLAASQEPGLKAVYPTISATPSFDDPHEYFLLSPERTIIPLQGSAANLVTPEVYDLAVRGMEETKGAGVFGFENDGLLWLLAPVPGDPASSWLAMARTLTSLAQPVSAHRGAEDQRLVVVSSYSGAIGAPDLNDEVRRLLDGRRAELVNTAGSVELPGNGDIVYAFSRSGPLTNLTRPSGRPSVLYVMLRVDLDAATASLFYGVWRIALFGLLYIALVAGLGVWLSQRLVNPIMRLRAAFARLETGDLEQRVELNTGDELEELGESMNQMARTLQGTYRTLADKLLLLDEKARQLALSLEVARAINRSLSLPTLLDDVLREVRKVVTADRMAIGILNDEYSHLEFVGSWPSREGRMKTGGTLAEQAIAHRRVCLYTLDGQDDSPDALLLEGAGMHQVCYVPLISTTGPVGVLVLADSVEDAFRIQEVDLLESLSPTLANAVEHGRLYAQQARFAGELERQVLERTRELEEAQQRLVQTEKFAASGEIAANVAHEVNNPLSIIKNHLRLVHGQILRPHLGTEDSNFVRDSMTIIEEEIDRIARIVDQLRRLNAPVNQTLDNVDVNKEVRLLVQLFRQTFYQKKIHVELRLDPTLGIVTLCNDYLRQIQINLLRNAFDALALEGRILIETIAHAPAHGYFTLLVKDNGTGIAPEAIGKIFDPFYTTKKEGKGTGLGLSVSYGLARQMGGGIAAASPPEGGAEFRLTVPMTPSGQTEQSPASGNMIRRQGRRIIIG